MFYHPNEDPQKSSQQVSWGSFILFIIVITIIVSIFLYLSKKNQPYIHFLSEGNFSEAMKY